MDHPDPHSADAAARKWEQVTARWQLIQDKAARGEITEQQLENARSHYEARRADYMNKTAGAQAAPAAVSRPASEVDARTRRKLREQDLADEQQHTLEQLRTAPAVTRESETAPASTQSRPRIPRALILVVAALVVVAAAAAMLTGGDETTGKKVASSGGGEGKADAEIGEFATDDTGDAPDPQSPDGAAPSIPDNPKTNTNPTKPTKPLATDKQNKLNEEIASEQNPDEVGKPTGKPPREIIPVVHPDPAQPTKPLGPLTTSEGAPTVHRVAQLLGGQATRVVVLRTSRELFKDLFEERGADAGQPAMYDILVSGNGFLAYGLMPDDAAAVAATSIYAKQLGAGSVAGKSPETDMDWVSHVVDASGDPDSARAYVGVLTVARKGSSIWVIETGEITSSPQAVIDKHTAKHLEALKILPGVDLL